MVEGLLEALEVPGFTDMGGMEGSLELVASSEFMGRVERCLDGGDAAVALSLARHLSRQLPGHLAAMLAEARAWNLMGETDLARAGFEAVLQTDPENREARLALDEIACQMRGEAGLRGFLAAIGETADRLLELEGLWRRGSVEQATALAQKMPDLPKARIILAVLLLQEGRDAEGMALFHDALAREPSHSIARRVLEGHPLERLLLEPLVAWPNGDLDPIRLAGLPAHVRAAKGDALAEPVAEPSVETLMAAPEMPEETVELADQEAGAQVETTDPVLMEVQAELDRIAATLAGQQRWPPTISSGRVPALRLLVSSRVGLESAYRQDGFQAVDDRLRSLVEAMKAQGEETRLVYVDDPEGAAPFEPVDAEDPVQVRRLILQIKKATEESGRTLRYLLLVGGHQVLPPFRLPNPADDDDDFVLTDNPYGCPEGEVLLPDLAVGRLPDAEASRPDVLLRLLDWLLEARQNGDGGRSVFWRGLWPFAKEGRRGGNGHLPTLGYSASLWREASRAVYGALTDPRQLRMSPPLTYRYVSSLAAERPSIAYFNLHGLADSQCWYGQRDPLFRADYPPFPLALRPADVDNRFEDAMVFSSACHGALCWGAQAENRLATRFMLMGSRALVGSTGTSYGSIMPPVACADLLAEGFLDALVAGHSAGDALVYARLRLAQEMMARQGYLDGEDQKTLLTFVLYGDPSLQAKGASGPRQDLDRLHPEVILTSDHPCDPEVPAHLKALAPKLLRRIREVVRERVPEMDDAAVEITSGPSRPGNSRRRAGVRPKGPGVSERALVFRLRKRVRDDGYDHDMQLRITAQADGRVVKMTMSR